MAAITKYRAGGLNHSKLFSYNSGIRLRSSYQQGWFHLQSLSFADGCPLAIFSPGVFCAWQPSVSASFPKDISQIGLGPYPNFYFNLVTSSKSLSSNMVTCEVHHESWGLGLQYEFGGAQFRPNICFVIRLGVPDQDPQTATKKSPPFSKFCGR